MTDPVPRYEVVPYRPEGGYSSKGSGLLLLTSLLGGLILGLIAGFVSRWFYFILVFPALIGLGVGAAGNWAARIGKVRSTTLSGISGLLGGVFAMLSMHYVGYLEFEDDFKLPPPMRGELLKVARLPRDLIEKLPGLDAGQKAMLQDPKFQAALGVHDFPSYMNFKATVGVEISRFSGGRNQKGMNLGYVGSWIYWGVEVLIVAGIALALQAAAAREPFCSQCQVWKTERTLGMVPLSETEPLLNGDLDQLLGKPPAQEPAVVLVTLHACPECEGDGTLDLKLAELFADKQGNIQRKEKGHVTYPGEALPHLQAVFAPPPEPPAPTEGDEPNVPEAPPT